MKFNLETENLYLSNVYININLLFFIMWLGKIIVFRVLVFILNSEKN